MFEGLDNVAWGTLHHAYGPAADVPRLLREIASDDAAVRNSAWDSLHSNLWHQGTVYEATEHAVPFLIELSQTSQVADRHLVLAYLGFLATGSSYWDVHQHLSLFAEERNKRDFKERLDQELAWVHATRAAVRAGTDHYAVLLTDPEPLVRAGAAYLIGHFHEDAERNIGLIRRYLDAEDGREMVRAACVLSVGLLATAHKDAATWLEQVLATEDSNAVRIAAALGLAWSKRDAVPAAARALLAEAATSPGAAKATFAQFPWDAPDIQTYCSEALAVATIDPAQSLPALIKALDDVPPYQSWDIARSMLHLVFGGKPLPTNTTSDTLTKDQRAALEAIAHSKAFWTGFGKNTYVANTMELLRSFGLPDKPEAFRAFINSKG
jgi:hypothetical protein